MHSYFTYIHTQIFEKKSNHDTFLRIVGATNKLIKNCYCTGVRGVGGVIPPPRGPRGRAASRWSPPPICTNFFFAEAHY